MFFQYSDFIFNRKEIQYVEIFLEECPTGRNYEMWAVFHLKEGVTVEIPPIVVPEGRVIEFQLGLAEKLNQ